MPSAHIVRQSAIVRSPRVLQLQGLFDVAVSETSGECWDVTLPLEARDWHVGLIVGPSGSGKTTIARELFGSSVCAGFDWPTDKAIVDGFPIGTGIKDVCALLSAVGFSSPPLWLRPFHVLSTGQQMRVNVARLLAEQPGLSVMDEFTSTVDRTVAQIGSAAIAKTVRKRAQKFVAVTCHYDVQEWLQPDWVYQPHLNEFLWCFPGKRPNIELRIARVHPSAWSLFAPYHYLSRELHRSARCFVAFYAERPVAFASALHFPHPSDRRIKREHRTVCLPDFQGVGIGNALSDTLASMWKGLGFRFQSQTANPAMVNARVRSANWRMIARPNNTTKSMGIGDFTKNSGVGGSPTRMRATFEYVGLPMRLEDAQRLCAEA